MADNANSLEGLHIDLSMENFLLEYPLECLPSKLNKRTGKALRCPSINDGDNSIVIIKDTQDLYPRLNSGQRGVECYHACPFLIQV
jgi:hypothetical protein